MPPINVGDHFIHPRVFTIGDHSWQRRYDVLAVHAPTTRFDKPDVMLDVRISSIDTRTGESRVIDANRPMWASQAAKGL
jgi:hypothetical protein